MNKPRIRLSWLVAFVAIAALNFGAIRALYYDLRTGLNANRLDVLALGALPMANVLVVGAMLARWRRSSRFLLGFLVFGVIALLLYVLVWTFYADAWVRYYVFLVLNPVRGVVGYLRPDALNTIFYSSVVAVLLGWPQMAFALVGGALSKKFSPRIIN